MHAREISTTPIVLLQMFQSYIEREIIKKSDASDMIVLITTIYHYLYLNGPQLAVLADDKHPDLISISGTALRICHIPTH
jgi:hypothetical protein